MRPPCMTQDFHRIKRLPPYVFAEVNALKSKARSAGEDIIDIGMGNPDQPPPQHGIDKLAATQAATPAHLYSPPSGTPWLHAAPFAFYDRTFGSDLLTDALSILTIATHQGTTHLPHYP